MATKKQYHTEWTDFARERSIVRKRLERIMAKLPETSDEYAHAKALYQRIKGDYTVKNLKKADKATQRRARLQVHGWYESASNQLSEIKKSTKKAIITIRERYGIMVTEEDLWNNMGLLAKAAREAVSGGKGTYLEYFYAGANILPSLRNKDMREASRALAEAMGVEYHDPYAQ